MIPSCIRDKSDFQDSSVLASFIRAFFSTCLSDVGRSGVITIVLALLGVLLLKAAYSLIDTKWPEAYTSVEDQANVHLRTNPLRTYLLFRGGPVFMVTTFIVVSIERTHGLIWIGFWIMTLCYLGSTTGRAIRDMLKPPRHPSWTMLCVFHILSIFMVVSFGVLAVYLRSLFAPIIPEGQELLIAIWAGAFATMLSSATRSMLAPHRVEGFEVVRSIKRDIGDKAWRYLVNSTPNKGEFLSFAMAVVLAESQQRPHWFRKLERIGGKFRGAGTYGVAQVAADEPLTDEESIDSMLRRLDTPEVHFALKEGDYSAEIYDVCRSWNEDDSHVSRILDFYDQVKLLRELSDELD